MKSSEKLQGVAVSKPSRKRGRPPKAQQKKEKISESHKKKMTSDALTEDTNKETESNIRQKELDNIEARTSIEEHTDNSNSHSIEPREAIDSPPALDAPEAELSSNLSESEEISIKV